MGGKVRWVGAGVVAGGRDDGTGNRQQPPTNVPTSQPGNAYQRMSRHVRRRFMSSRALPVHNQFVRR